MNDLHYRLPPDMLHYEPKYLFGLGLQDLMIAVMPSILMLQVAGAIGAVVTAVLMLAGMVRFERFGNRSVVTYSALWLWHKYRPSTVILPRIMPRQETRLEVTTWDDQPLYTLDVDK
ncbi:MAG: hypothetical protein WA821_18595 [Anaerolineales bacterium]